MSQGAEHLRASIDHAVAGLTTTFATSYGKRLSLEVRTSPPVGRFLEAFWDRPALTTPPNRFLPSERPNSGSAQEMTADVESYLATL